MMNARRLRALLLSRVPALALNVESSSDHSCLSPSGTAKPMPRTPRIGCLIAQIVQRAPVLAYWLHVG